MKRIPIILLLFTLVACSSPVEKYIENDFARVVRENALDEEVQNEINRVVNELENMADVANPEAKEAKELAAKANKLNQEITSRLSSYKRTGSYSYIINIGHDVENFEAMSAKARKLEKKAKPYTDHKNKQIKSLVDAFHNVDTKALMNSQDLVKNESVTVENIFNQAFGDPANMVSLSEEELSNLASAYMTNYFVDNPTKSVLAYKFQKNSDRLYIKLSDETQYFLSAIECGNGEYSYQYIQTNDPFQGAATN